MPLTKITVEGKMKTKAKKMLKNISAIFFVAVLTIIVIFIFSDDNSMLYFNDDKLQYADDETSNELVKMYLERFVFDIRNVPNDEFELKINIADAYLLFSRDYYDELTEFLDINNAFVLLENNITVEIEFTFYERIKEKLWRVQWEETYKIEDKLQEPITMAGYFTYYQEYPVTEEIKQFNPLGIYFSEIYIYNPEFEEEQL